MTRRYTLGRRQASVDSTAASILEAARALISERQATQLSVGQIARRAGVSRLTIYNRFGSKAALFQSVARPVSSTAVASQPTDAREALRQRVATACRRWALDPAFHRHLPRQSGDTEEDRDLAERLAAADQLRPGCSIKEAEDVIGAVSSFDLFDRLYKDGRRPTGAVTEILMRLVSTILA